MKNAFEEKVYPVSEVFASRRRRQRLKSGEQKFYSRVYRVVARIPRGRVLAYGEVARRAGVPAASRAVGNAMAENQNWPQVPCHRVVCSDGRVGSWSGRGGRARKIALLEREGWQIRRGKLSQRKNGR